MGQTAQPSFVMWRKPLACMEGPASLVAITIPSSSVPAHSLTLEISANTLRKVSVEEGESMKDHANSVVDIAAWEHLPILFQTHYYS